MEIMKMKTVFSAVRTDRELDVICFNTLDEADAFCQRHNEYQIIETRFYSLSDALAIFGETV